jgi:hypothetical protein
MDISCIYTVLMVPKYMYMYILYSNYITTIAMQFNNFIPGNCWCVYNVYHINFNNNYALL